MVLCKLRWLLILLSIVISSCKAIIEPSLTKRQIVLQAPADNYQTTIYNVGFWWDEVEDALSYKLQIVNGTFDTPGSLIADTLLKKNKFNLNLSPGTYQWRVQAVNGSSQSAFGGPRTFTVNSSSITQQSVQLSSPGSGLTTNSIQIAFQWGLVFGATKYHFQIDTNSFINEKAITFEQTIPGQQLNYSFPKDQSYQWRVRAENDTAVSRWSLVNQVIYDHTPPGKVSLTSPTDAEMVTRPVSLTWGVVPTANRYRLYVFKSDSTSAYNGSFPVLVNTNSYSFDLGASGDKVFWKVSAIDAAGNEGPVSTLRNFSLR